MAIDFSNDHIALGTWNIAVGNQITISAWIKIDSFPGLDPRIIMKGDSVNSQEWGLLVDDGPNTLEFRLITSSATSLDSSTSLSTGTLYFVAATYDGATMRVYIDGDQDNSKSASGNISQSSTNIWIGDQGITAGQRDFDGTIEDVRVYSRALSAAEIKTIYSLRGRDGIRQGLEGHWLMNEAHPGLAVPATANQIRDISGNNRHGDIDGTSPTYAASDLSYKRRRVS
jgi:hypothetical protein